MNDFNKKLLLVLLFLFLLGMGFVSYGSLFGFVPETGIGREALAAALGALFVVLATGVQLHQQTDMEVERHKKQITYDNRLKTYKELLDTRSKFNDGKITLEKFEYVGNKKLQAHLVCDQSDTFESLEIFLRIVKEIQARSEQHEDKLNDNTDKPLLNEAYECLAVMMMLDLKDGDLGRSTKNSVNTINNAKDAFEWFRENDPPPQGDKDPKSTAQGANNKLSIQKLTRNTDKVSFNTKEYQKNQYVYEVLKDYILNSKPTFNEFQKKYTKEALGEIEGLRNDHFLSSNPMWLTKEAAEEKKSKSSEGDSWNRYWIDERSLLEFKDGVKIAVRRGQDVNSIESFQKWCHHNKIRYK
jgi:hypothetical protein